MKKRLISEYSSFILLFFGILLICMNFYLFAIFVFIIWYCLFGMVGLAFTYSTKGNIRRSNLFLNISIPITLLPFRRAFYYWTKAANVLLSDSGRVLEAYDIAKKVNVNNLYTDNDKSMFFSFWAVLLSGLGDKEGALKYVEIAQQLPHKECHNDYLENLKKQL